MTDKELAKILFDAGVKRADPFKAVADHVADCPKPDQIIAVGKAAGRMAEAALLAFPDTPCLVVTNPENAKPVGGATVMQASHPVPDENGAKAAAEVIRRLQSETGEVLALISGGGSALLPAPVAGITLTEKAKVNELLLGAGLDIRQMNLVRQQLSDLKGGGFLRHAAPAHVTALILSDVIGDDLAAIASGPTVAPLGTVEDARQCLVRAGLWDMVPVSVKSYLSVEKQMSTPESSSNTLIGSNALSLSAMAAAHPDAHVIETPVEGDVADAARQICDGCKEGVTLWGGETTVVLKGDGRGGRNQELALRIALEARDRGWTNWTCLQGGTDGRDGPTDAAGGLVDHGTLDRIAAAGGDIDALLANNDSHKALSLANDLLMTGGTGTNVADLGVLIRR